MKFDYFLSEVSDKTEAGLRSVLIAQGKMRLAIATPVILCNLIFLSVAHDSVPAWFVLLTVGYSLYAATLHLCAHKFSQSLLKRLLVITSITDPVALSVWIALTGAYGALISGFYLFTTLGFGFRTGRPLMHLCQSTSILGFIGVLAAEPFWQQRTVIWFALLVPLIAVPMYAGSLIKKLQNARRQAEQESLAKSELLAKVSHELRTPLTGIVASAEILAAESDDRSVTRRTDTILQMSETLLSEINDLLDEAKYDAQAIELSLVPVDLGIKFATLRTTFDGMASKKGLSFGAKVDTAIRDQIMADTHHLDRVLLNLVGNAFKFTEQGNVDMTAALIDENDDGYRIRISVTDTGIGIPESFHEKIFEPFSQVEQGAARRYGGTGLGLSLTRKIVKRMGGDLRFESTLGKGSRFWFDLNVTRSDQPAQVGASEKPANIIPPKRILVAEDNETNRILIEELLKIDHHQVIACSSGMAALELLTERDFDVLMLDYNLGDMDGVRVLQTYRFGRLNPAPALFLTADVTIQTATRLREAGGTGILYKPINLNAIRDALAQIDFRDEAPAADTDVSSQPKKPRPALSIVPISPLDQNVIDALKNASTRPDFLPMLLGHAEDDIEKCCHQLLNGLSSTKDYAGIRSTAHALKGVCVNVGAVRLATLASSIMRLSSEELGVASSRLIGDVEESSRATLQALRATIAETQPQSSGSTSALHLD